MKSGVIYLAAPDVTAALITHDEGIHSIARTAATTAAAVPHTGRPTIFIFPVDS